jgi:hypothetical protein
MVDKDIVRRFSQLIEHGADDALKNFAPVVFHHLLVLIHEEEDRQRDKEIEMKVWAVMVVLLIIIILW